MQRILLVLILLATQTTFAQMSVGALLGATGYIGDLNSKPLKRVKPSIGFSFIYEVNNYLNLRSGLLLGQVEGGDKYSGTDFLKQVRNLSFQSEISEFHVGVEFNVLNLDKYRWSPYGFGGLALFRFKPYAKEGSQRVYLKPLSTEGQGLVLYPDRKPYSLTQLAFPFGGGLKYKYNEFLTFAWEVTWRPTLTDYLDDVSTNYPDPDALFATKGPEAVIYSYRGLIRGFPTNDIRGGPKKKDWYYFTGFHITYKIYDKPVRKAQPKNTPAPRM